MTHVKKYSPDWLRTRIGHSISSSSFIRNILSSFSCFIVRDDPLFESHRHFYRRKALMDHRKINVVLDVGGSNGSWILELRNCGYSGKVVSFEPVVEAFVFLQKRADKDSLWLCENCALGDTHEERFINVLGDTPASSFLTPTKLHIDAYPEMSNYRTEKTVVKRLDDIYQHYCIESDQVYLKIDAQGYEKKILQGAKQSLSHIQMIQLETSFVPCYEGEPLVEEMISFMREMNFIPVGIVEHGSYIEDNSQRIQADFIFWKV